MSKKPFPQLNGHLRAQQFGLVKLISHLADQGSIDLEKYLFSLSNQATAERSHEPEFSDSLERIVASVRLIHPQGKQPQVD